MLKVCHLTSVHPRYDTRIFIKECVSLVNNDYLINIVVADGKGNECLNKINIYDVGKPKNRIDRLFNVTRRVFSKAKLLDADIYHLHDPELIPMGLKLKRLGKKVIFDAHEDVPKQILAKSYLYTPVKWSLSKVFQLYESWACKKINAVITATPYIRNKFLLINPNTIDINNFPIIGELTISDKPSKGSLHNICYIGGLTAIRGIKEMVKALTYVKQSTHLQLAGCFTEVDVENEVKTYVEWGSVEELGWLDRNGIKDLLNHSVAGLVTLHSTTNYIDALPVKMFEYMSAGIPVIASDFPLWKKIIEDNDCGICVDPMKPKAIADAINFLINNPTRAEQMGRNGQVAIKNKYNWKNEESKLYKLYDSLIKE